jgi:signal transduction histidine kinase
MRSLRTRIVVLVAGFGLAMGAALAVIMYQAISGYHTEADYERASRFAERIGAMHPDLWKAYQGDPEGFARQFREFNQYTPDIGLYLLDNDGRVLVRSDRRTGEAAAGRIDVSPVARALARNPGMPISGEDPENPGVQRLVAAMPVFDEAVQRGWLYVVPRKWIAAAGETYRDYALRTAGRVGLLTLAIGVLLTLATMITITRPLTRLTNVADRITKSGFEAEITECDFRTCSRHDEIGRLSCTLREMFERLKIEIQRVKRTDAARREMIASVSHDLRTPLTALLGQLETIRIKRDVLDAEATERLQERALQNAQYLRKLTEALAELARLDSPEFRVQVEPLQIGELTDDVVQRFATRAEGRGIQLVVDYPDGLPLAPVDAALLDRALSNLLDNALRVTPDGGRVSVEVTRTETGMRVAVTDSGPGVALEEQESVFELFYQTSKHRESRGNSGLGLAIVRRVAELHGGRAGLRSRPGEGATFFIDLPAAA